MLWCLTKVGSCAVQDNEGNWIGTFKDTYTAQDIIAKHNETVEGIMQTPTKGWGTKIEWGSRK